MNPPLRALRAALPCARLFVLASALALCGCAPTRYSDGDPSAQTQNVPAVPALIIPARIRYDGNRDYLPRSLSDGTGEAQFTAVYVYQVIYDAEKEHPLTVFNPLLIAGMSKSDDAVTILAQLEMFDGNELVRKYEKSVVLSKSKTLFSEGQTLTEMRRNGLLHVRDDIDRRIAADRQFWQSEARR